MANGLREPKPTGYVPEQYAIEDDRVVAKNSFVPPISPGWWRRNFTLGNILMIGSMLFTALLFGNGAIWQAKLVDAATDARVVSVERSVVELKSQTANRETVDAKLDSILRQITEIDQRLQRIEARR